jgi:hypothetical protein
MVNALPAAGSVVVVHSVSMRIYVQRMIRDVRGSEVGRVSTVEVCHNLNTARNALTGRQPPVVIDHAFYDHVSANTASLVRELAAGCNAILP